MELQTWRGSLLMELTVEVARAEEAAGGYLGCFLSFVGASRDGGWKV